MKFRGRKFIAREEVVRLIPDPESPVIRLEAPAGSWRRRVFPLVRTYDQTEAGVWGELD